MNLYYQQDILELDTDKITEHKHPTWGEVTVFHDVVIASEIVHEYSDGYAYKPRDELREYAWTADGRWVIVGSHPVDGIISERDQVAGRTVNPRYVKNLQDPETGRPNRAGVVADVEIFNTHVSPQQLQDMRNGSKPDVSIGFFYSKDMEAGVVTDGPFKDTEYDYVQRNMFHDHLAAGIDQGRCPSPYCGLGVDELRKRLTGDPFKGFEDFEDCVSTIMEEQDVSRESAEKICGKLEAEEKKEDEESPLRTKVKEVITLLMDELEEVKGMKDAQETEEWYKNIPWREEPYTIIYSNLNEDTRETLRELGLCPTCGDEKDEGDEARTEAERAMSHFDISKEEWESMSTEKQQEYIDKLPERGSKDTEESKETEKSEESEEEKCPDGEHMNEEGECVPDEKKEEDSMDEEPEPVDVDKVLKRAERVLGSRR